MLLNFFEGSSQGCWKRIPTGNKNNEMKHHKKAQSCTPNNKTQKQFRVLIEHIQLYIICATCFTVNTDSSYTMFNTKNKTQQSLGNPDPRKIQTILVQL